MSDSPKSEPSSVERLLESTFVRGGLNTNQITPRPSPPVGQSDAQTVSNNSGDSGSSSGADASS